MATAIAPPQIPIETRPPRGALLVLLAGVFTSLLDFFIVNVALPDTQRELHAGPSAVQCGPAPSPPTGWPSAPRLLPESRASGAGRIDLGGAALVTLGLVAIVLPLVEGQQQGWPAWVFLCMAASVPLLGGFALHQRRLAAGAGGLRSRHGAGDRPDARHRAGPGEARTRGRRLRGAVHHPAGGRLDGVAVIGAVFYSALGGGYPHAFELSLAVMAGFGVAVAALVQPLRRSS